jgi:hypothetical protein
MRVSVVPRNTGVRGKSRIAASCASWCQRNSASTTPPASKKAISSPVTQLSRHAERLVEVHAAVKILDAESYDIQSERGNTLTHATLSLG